MSSLYQAVIYAHSMRKKGGIQRCPYRKGVVRTVLLQRGPDGLGLSITVSVIFCLQNGIGRVRRVEQASRYYNLRNVSTLY